MQFLGQHEHSIDAKGRLILPADFRAPLEEGAVVAKGRGRCLAVYPEEEWEKVASRARELASEGERQRRAARALFAGARHVVPDRQGRVAVPANLRDYAGLTREVVVTGAFSHVEIWNSEEWARQSEDGDGELAGVDMPGLGM